MNRSSDDQEVSIFQFHSIPQIPQITRIKTGNPRFQYQVESTSGIPIPKLPTDPEAWTYGFRICSQGSIGSFVLFADRFPCIWRIAVSSLLAFTRHSCRKLCFSCLFVCLFVRSFTLFLLFFIKLNALFQWILTSMYLYTHVHPGK